MRRALFRYCGWGCLALAVASSWGRAGAADSPRAADDLLRLVPPDATVVLTVESLRDQVRTIGASRLVADLRQLPAVRSWLESEKYRALAALVPRHRGPPGGETGRPARSVTGGCRGPGPAARPRWPARSRPGPRAAPAQGPRPGAAREADRCGQLGAATERRVGAGGRAPSGRDDLSRPRVPRGLGPDGGVVRRLSRRHVCLLQLGGDDPGCRGPKAFGPGPAESGGIEASQRREEEGRSGPGRPAKGRGCPPQAAGPAAGPPVCGSPCDRADAGPGAAFGQARRPAYHGSARAAPGRGRVCRGRAWSGGPMRSSCTQSRRSTPRGWTAGYGDGRATHVRSVRSCAASRGRPWPWPRRPSTCRHRGKRFTRSYPRPTISGCETSKPS